MLYIDHLSNLCLECDPQFLQEIHLYPSIKKKRRRETSGIFKYQSLTPEQVESPFILFSIYVASIDLDIWLKIFFSNYIACSEVLLALNLSCIDSSLSETTRAFFIVPCCEVESQGILLLWKLANTGHAWQSVPVSWTHARHKDQNGLFKTVQSTVVVPFCI